MCDNKISNYLKLNNKYGYNNSDNGIFIMWNKNMVDNNGNNYYFINKLSKIYILSSQYSLINRICINEIKCAFYKFFENEDFIKKILFKILDNFKICNCNCKNKNELNTISNLKIYEINNSEYYTRGCVNKPLKCQCSFFSISLDNLKKIISKLEKLILNFKIWRNLEYNYNNLDLFYNRISKFFINFLNNDLDKYESFIFLNKYNNILNYNKLLIVNKLI